ncbi:hypothetical protein CM15mP35_07990 [bacterium]|nr:MAG: hypothetical protein CM15mP35_07990 [bacterium]
MDKGTVIFDYGGANIGKSLHVGHIRTLNIGRSLTNIYKMAGYKTITDIHFEIGACAGSNNCIH